MPKKSPAPHLEKVTPRAPRRRRAPGKIVADETLAVDERLDGAPAPTPEPPPKRPVGRPTKYELRFNEMLIAHMSMGLSFESFAGEIGVNQDTLHEWAKVQPEFSEAKKIAWSANLLFWEKMGVRGAMGTLKGFNVASWIFNMKNRHRWNDGQQEKDDNPLERVADQFRRAQEALEKKYGAG